MKILKATILVGGILNLLLALFHLVLCQWIYRDAHGSPLYPLMQMLAVGGCVMIWFLALTSLFLREQLVTSRAGRSIIALNIAIYAVRVVGEGVFFPHPKPIIIILCSGLAALYAWVLLQAKYATANGAPGA